MNKGSSYDFIFQHLIDLPSCNCVFASVKERVSGRRRLFLFNHEKNHVFKRNGIKDTWDQLMEEDEVESVRSGLCKVIENRSIPCYQANDLNLLS